MVSTLAILIRQEIHPKMPVWDPQNEFFGVPWIMGLLLGIAIFFTCGTPSMRREVRVQGNLMML